MFQGKKPKYTMEWHKILYLTLTSPLWFFYVGDLYLLQETEMKQYNLGFLTMKIYTVKTYDIFLSY